jgi:hypothetical protein
MAPLDRLLAPGGSREDALAISTGRILLVEARGQSPAQSFAAYIPKAVSQAIALLKCAKYVRIFYFIQLSECCLPALRRSASVYLMGSPGCSSS